MASTTTELSIVNRGLQLLGYQPISSLQENSRGARAMNRAYQPVLLDTLRGNFWSFSIMRALLAASATPPAFGMANYFPLPGDYVMLAMPDQVNDFTFGAIPSTPNSGPIYRDWQLENAGGYQAIASNDPGPLHVRYVSSNVTEGMFDVCFAEALSANLAHATCEELTQSNSKFQMIEKIHDDAIELAKQRNAFEKRPVRSPVDRWILARM